MDADDDAGLDGIRANRFSMVGSSDGFLRERSVNNPWVDRRNACRQIGQSQAIGFYSNYYFNRHPRNGISSGF